MRLSQLLHGVEAQIEGSDPEIVDVRDEVGAVQPGDLLVVRSGRGAAQASIKEAVERGARAIVVEWPVPFAGARALVPSTDEAWTQIVANRDRR
jgi:UDP-N-acetylmuramyl tripeptide synthase